MTDKNDIIEIVYQALESLNAELEPEKRISLALETGLFGADASLDSLSLVSVIVDVEGLVQDRYGRSISLADDRAMSQMVSPFSTVDTLASYVVVLLDETV